MNEQAEMGTELPFNRLWEAIFRCSTEKDLTLFFLGYDNTLGVMNCTAIRSSHSVSYFASCKNWFEEIFERNAVLAILSMTVELLISPLVLGENQ